MDHSALPKPRKHFPNWLLWFSWVAASTAAILLGAGLLYALIFIAQTVNPGLNEDRFAGWIMFPLVATLLGLAQWLVLRQRIPRFGWWVLATGAGMPAGVALASGVVQAINHFTGLSWLGYSSQPRFLFLVGLVGFVLGLAQIPILWRHIRSLALWLLASMVGWLVLGLIVGVSIDKMSDILAFGAVPAAFTGLGLLWLLRTPDSQTNQPI